LILLALAGMIRYGYEENPAVTLQECLADPARFDGQRIIIATEVTVVRTWPDSLWIRQMGKRCTVVGAPGAAQPGEYLSLIARFHAPGWLELEALHAAKGRRAKILWSILPPLLLAAGWVAAYRFDFRKGWWEEREKCRIS